MDTKQLSYGYKYLYDIDNICYIGDLWKIF